MKNNKFTLEVIDNKLYVDFKHPWNIADLMQMLFTVQLETMNNTLSRTPDEYKDEVRDELYNLYNSGAASVLEQFAPDKELHPDLTVEAMLDAENQYIDKRYEEVKSCQAEASTTAPDADQISGQLSLFPEAQANSGESVKNAIPS